MEDESTLAKKRKLTEQAALKPFLKLTKQQKLGKIPTTNSKDRISELPNSLIHHILSFCTVKDAVTFCSLSRHWKSLWTTIPALSFRCGETQHVCAFATFVDRALMLFSANKAEKFLLDFRYKSRYKDRVDSWIRFAVIREVVEVNLNFRSRYTEVFESWCFVSLKVVCLEELSLGVEIIRSIFCGSPLIESLILRKCMFIENVGNTFVIDASDTSLMILVVDGCEIGYGFDFDFDIDIPYVASRKVHLEIRCPNIVSLTVVGNMRFTCLKLIDVSSLVEANIGFCIDRCAAYERNMIKDIVEKLRHVKRLTIGAWLLQVLSTMRLDGKIFPILRCESLKINMKMKKIYLPGMEVLLHSSPSLKQLIVNVVTRKTHNFYRKNHALKENYWRSETWILRCLDENLENVEIIGFDAGYPSWNWGKILVEMVQFLLDNAKVLKKLTIHAQGDNLDTPLELVEPKKLRNFLEIKENILQYPRASRDAVVIFQSGLH